MYRIGGLEYTKKITINNYPSIEQGAGERERAIGYVGFVKCFDKFSTSMHHCYQGSIFQNIHATVTVTNSISGYNKFLVANGGGFEGACDSATELGLYWVQNFKRFRV